RFHRDTLRHLTQPGARVDIDPRPGTVGIGDQQHDEPADQTDDPGDQHGNPAETPDAANLLNDEVEGRVHRQNMDCGTTSTSPGLSGMFSCTSPLLTRSASFT